MSKKKEWVCLTAGFLGSMLGLYGVIAFNQFADVIAVGSQNG